jgi:hypothetical protein
LICPECGSYQPNRAKYCGICGCALSQDGLVESFLGKEGEAEIVIPRHRSPLFYLAITMIVILALAILTGAGYLVYWAAWGGEAGEDGDEVIEDNSQHYMNSDIGFSLSYPENWTLEEGQAQEDELLTIEVIFSSRKYLELSACQLDPVITIGGIESIKEFAYEDADKRMGSLGGMPLEKANADTAGTNDTTGSTDAQSGYAQEEPPQGEDTVQENQASETASAEATFTSSSVGDLDAFYTEFSANIMGEETRFLLYYIVADDYLFTLIGRAPAVDYGDVRPLFMAIAGSFEWERDEEVPPAGIPPISIR